MSAAKGANKKPPMSKGGKPPFTCPPGANVGAVGGYQSSTPPGQGSYNQYGQGYGPGKKPFNQNQGGAGGYSYSTAYPSQVTGGAGGSQDYSYEGEFRGRIDSGLKQPFGSLLLLPWQEMASLISHKDIRVCGSQGNKQVC